MRDGRPTVGSLAGREQERKAAREASHATMTLAAITDALITEESGPAKPYVAFKANSGAWILVPDRPPIRTAGLALYHPQSLRGAFAKNLIAAGAWRPQSRRVRQETLDELKGALNGFVGDDELHCAFYLRAPGPFAKAIVLAMDSAGRPIAYVKIAATEQSARAIAHEAEMLERLARIPSLAHCVPRVMARARWRDYPILVLSAGPLRSAPRGFDGIHREFLDHLGASTRSTRRLSDSRMLAEIRGRFDASHEALPGPWRSRYAWALEEIEKRGGAFELPLSLAHGDFVPWNMRRNKDGSLYVFDWELAAAERTAGWDALHFRLARHAFGIGPRGGVGLEAMCGLLARDDRDAGELLLLAYLTDVGLFCQHRLIEAGAPTTNPFIAAAGDLLDALRQRLR